MENFCKLKSRGGQDKADDITVPRGHLEQRFPEDTIPALAAEL